MASPNLTPDPSPNPLDLERGERGKEGRGYRVAFALLRCLPKRAIHEEYGEHEKWRRRGPQPAAVSRMEAPGSQAGLVCGGVNFGCVHAFLQVGIKKRTRIG